MIEGLIILLELFFLYILLLKVRNKKEKIRKDDLGIFSYKEE